MKHLTFLYNDKKNYTQAKKESKKQKYKSVLIQVYTAITNIDKIQTILDTLSVDFVNALVIGTTSAGEISHAKMYDDQTVISLSLFKSTKLSHVYVENIDKDNGENLSSKICSKNTKAAVVLSEGLKGKDYEGFIKGIKKENPSLIIAGGLAGDNFKLEKTYIFLANKIYTSGAVAVSFSSKKLYADNKYNLNWTPIGKEFTITLSKGNVVHEIDSQSAVKFFKKYLGEELFINNAASLSDFQLLYKEGKTIVSRTPMAVDDDAIVFAGPIKEGQKVQFGFSNASSVISGSDALSQKVSKKPAEAIYVFSCIARKKLLGKVLENEFASFEAIAPTAGFFTYGEFYSTSKNNALLNCTTTILILSENLKKPKNKIKNALLKRSLDSVTFSALTHFVKQTSYELNSNVKLLNQYKEAVDDASLVSKTDKHGVITYVNDSFCKISKYTREELLGQNHNIVRDKNVSSFIFKKMWDTIQSGKIWRGKFSNEAKDNSIYYVDATIMPIFNERGEIDEFIAIRRDITKEVLSKNRIKQKEKFIKAIFDNQDNIVVYTSKTKGMISVNKKLFEYFEYDSFEHFKSQNRCICDLFLDEEGFVHPLKDEDWLDTIANNEDVDHKAKMLTKYGDVNTFNIKVKKVEDEYIINLSDITNLESALQKAYSSEQTKSMFLANMSHEIRTPLNGILGFTDVLKNKNLDEESKKYINIIHKSGQTLLNVVNDILDFSKIESGELFLSLEKYDLVEEIQVAVATFFRVSQTKNIICNTYLDPKIPKVIICDAQRLKQVISNLISNAIKFTPSSGVIDINIVVEQLTASNVTIKFSVKDSGIGIPKDKQDSIFKAFSQADDTIGRKFGGTGLGLSISNQYVNMMGSSIKVLSEEGKGSEFYFNISLDIPNKDELYIEKKELTNKKFKGRVLVAEDNETNQMLIELLLSERALDFTIVDNGKEALEAIKAYGEYDLVLMDINMPVMDGISTIKYLRKDGYKRSVVSLSANVIDSDIQSFLKAGFDDTLNKPIIPSELDKMLSNFLEVKISKNEDYDIVDVDSLSNSLQIKDKIIIFKLLNSFVSSTTAIFKKLESQNIDKNLAHMVKGASGNLRFVKLYNLSIEFEKTMDNWSEEEHQRNKNTLISHLHELVKQIQRLNK